MPKEKQEPPEPGPEPEPDEGQKVIDELRARLAALESASEEGKAFRQKIEDLVEKAKQGPPSVMQQLAKALWKQA